MSRTPPETKTAVTSPKATTDTAHVVESIVSSGDTLTILEALGQVLTKVYKSDGGTETYDSAAHFKIHQVPVANLTELSALLTELEPMSNRCQIHGKFVGKDKAMATKYKNAYARTNQNFSDQPLHTFIIDVDKYKPGFGDPVEEPEICIQEYIRKVLPPEFQNVSFHWQLSSSAGQPSNLDVLKCHVWFWLKDPYTCAQLYEWAKAIGPQVDKVVYRRVQVRYTASPVFEEGRIDPVPVRSGLFRGLRDDLPLAIDEAMLAQARDQGAGEGGNDMKLVDPSEKDNLIGLFHKTFTAEQVLLQLFDGEFEQVTQRRFTWLNGGGTPEGVWVHDDDMHVGSSHNTWPIAGIANLWDLVREFKFGHLDKSSDAFAQVDIDSLPIQAKPSNLAMVEYASGLDEIKEQQVLEEAERRAATQAELAIFIARIGSAPLEEVNGALTEMVRSMKADGADPGTAATLDKAIQQRLKALSPNQAAPSIDEIRRQTRPVPKKTQGSRPVLDGDDHLGIARLLVKAEFRDESKKRLAVRTNGSWFLFGGQCYAEIDEEKIRNVAWSYLGEALRLIEAGVEAFKPSRNDVGGVVDALRSVLAADVPLPPAWLSGHPGPDPLDLIVMQNGILDVTTRELMEHTPAFFCLNTLPYCFDPAAQCPTWQRFLNDLWGDDEESKQLLGEWFGYCLTADTRQQKLLMIIGPKRSGKGTIARVLSDLVGHVNSIGPTLSSMCAQFGLEQWLGKLTAIIGDARGGGKDTQTVVERLLSITGEDEVPVARMYKGYSSCRLPARITIMSNELLRLGDASGALVGRMLILKNTKSFFDREDTSLSTKLAAELPGIFNWALEGKRRLAERGRFVQPSSAGELLKVTQEANNPVGTFVEDYCELGHGYEDRQSLVFEAWKAWCRKENRPAGTLTTFARDLSAADIEGVTMHRPRGDDGKQHRVYQGLRLCKKVVEKLSLLQFEET